MKKQKQTFKSRFARFVRPGKLNASVEQTVKQTADDFKHSVLLVSLLINAFVLTSWLVIQVTSRYDADLIAYLVK